MSLKVLCRRRVGWQRIWPWWHGMGSNPDREGGALSPIRPFCPFRYLAAKRRCASLVALPSARLVAMFGAGAFKGPALPVRRR